MRILHKTRKKYCVVSHSSILSSSKIWHCKFLVTISAGKSLLIWTTIGLQNTWVCRHHFGLSGWTSYMRFNKLLPSYIAFKCDSITTNASNYFTTPKRGIIILWYNVCNNTEAVKRQRNSGISTYTCLCLMVESSAYLCCIKKKNLHD